MDCVCWADQIRRALWICEQRCLIDKKQQQKTKQKHQQQTKQNQTNKMYTPFSPK